MSNIPHARERLAIIADALEDGRLSPSQAANRIRGLNPLLIRRSPKTRVTGRTAPCTPELTQEIRVFHKTAGSRMNQAEIAAVFNVNPGRVSEALDEA